MRAVCVRLPIGPVTARVGKPPKEEAAGGWLMPMEKVYCRSDLRLLQVRDFEV